MTCWARRSTKSELFERILAYFAKTEGRVKWASATFELVEGSTIRVPDDRG